MSAAPDDALLRRSPKGDALISAHAGSDGELVLGVEHYETAIASGADFAELDARRTADGVLVAHHDSGVGGREIAELTFAELRGLADCPPRVADVIQLTKGRVRLHVDIKEPGTAAVACTSSGEDVETGLRLAAGLAPFWIAHGLIDESRRSVAALLARSREPSLGRARTLAVVGLLRILGGELDGAQRACSESLTLSRPGEEWYRAVALNVLGTVARSRGRWQEAQRLYDPGLALATAEDLWWPAALAQANLGLLAELEGRHAEAVDRHQHSLEIARAGGDEWLVAMGLLNTGRAMRRLGELDRAGALQAQALRSFLAYENSWGIAACVASIAALATVDGHHARAARLFGAEQAIRERGRFALWHTIRDEHEAALRATASALGHAAWERAQSQGRALTRDEAIAEAIASAALRPSVATG